MILSELATDWLRAFPSSGDTFTVFCGTKSGTGTGQMFAALPLEQSRVFTSFQAWKDCFVCAYLISPISKGAIPSYSLVSLIIPHRLRRLSAIFTDIDHPSQAGLYTLYCSSVIYLTIPVNKTRLLNICVESSFFQQPMLTYITLAIWRV